MAYYPNHFRSNQQTCNEGSGMPSGSFESSSAQYGIRLLAILKPTHQPSVEQWTVIVGFELDQIERMTIPREGSCYSVINVSSYLELYTLLTLPPSHTLHHAHTQAIKTSFDHHTTTNSAMISLVHTLRTEDVRRALLVTYKPKSNYCLVDSCLAYGCSNNMAPTRGPLNACFSTAAALTLDRHRNLHNNGRGVLRKPPDGSSKATSVCGGVESHLDVVQLRGSTSGSSPEFLLPASTICNDVGFCFSSAVDSGLRCSVVELCLRTKCLYKLDEAHSDSSEQYEKKEGCADLKALNQKSKMSNRVAHSSRALAHQFCVLIFFLFFIVAYGGAHWLWKLFPVSTLCYGERANSEWIVRIEIKWNSSTSVNNRLCGNLKAAAALSGLSIFEVFAVQATALPCVELFHFKSMLTPPNQVERKQTTLFARMLAATHAASF
ncbi:hypothetical protein T07_10652 [Trichinella nelsoni]|uniref:Uncharacterized protein n=1 Tax=Trichinella nelsoni TaxID=6336 RepID=A0A0V0RGF0_9BILA|nr:hypothetical protein T07_10652 [Trichinella nelsoni]